MNSQYPYVYVLETAGDSFRVFTWPNVAKKYIKDCYTDFEGNVRLPPPGHLTLKRCKVNPKAGHAVVIDTLDIRWFLGADYKLHSEDA